MFVLVADWTPRETLVRRVSLPAVIRILGGGEQVMSLEVMLYGGFRLGLEIYHNRVFIKTCK